MGLAMEGTLIMPVLLIVIVAVIILIAIMRSASKARQCPYCKNYINGKATVCEYCHRDVTGILS